MITMKNSVFLVGTFFLSFFLVSAEHENCSAPLQLILWVVMILPEHDPDNPSRTQESVN